MKQITLFLLLLATPTVLHPGKKRTPKKRRNNIVLVASKKKTPVFDQKEQNLCSNPPKNNRFLAILSDIADNIVEQMQTNEKTNGHKFM